MESCIKEIAATVVLYNPETKELINNLSSYKDSVGHIILVDNSVNPITAELKSYIETADNLTYISMMGNKGIAAALNKAASIAIETKYSWLLTMDQDSEAPPGMVIEMWDFVTKNKINKLAIVAASPSSPVGFNDKHVQPWQFAETVYTSGNLLSLEAYTETSGWEEKLFIDRVDMIFNLDLQLRNWKIITLNNVVFKHKLGKERVVSVFGIKLRTITSHNYIRRYYIHRNRMYLLSNRDYVRNFPSTIKMELISLIKEPFKILLFEDEKIRKFKSIFFAQLDFRRKKFGKYEDNRRG